MSPISARATRPDEGDYEAIREAFMETERGRWFLGEYAKRNRNSDTRMVLDEVARLERVVAALQPAPIEPPPSEMVAAMMSLVDEAAEVAAVAAASLAIDARLAPIRTGARILEEISWRWREIGSEARTCDSIDAQVQAIQDSCRQLSAIRIPDTMSAAFDLMRRRLRELAEASGVELPRAAETQPIVDPAAADMPLAGQDGRQARVELRARPASLDAGRIEPGSCEAAGAASSAPARRHSAAEPPLQLHPSLGPTPFAAHAQAEPASDVLSAIRRMSLTEKITFFA
ncbi:hypothetical protein [Bradyrhizobium sp. STM 3809]|uniref:hypothetical protein n=1 Tax=Bradyrhizobium sp. STM 3809 TaxID=551936 RepID=UPI001F0AD45B|nr:hypothetical protein [Bradyrhizobium sp. STM 3809]